jgi:hypothetical protein
VADLIVGHRGDISDDVADVADDVADDVVSEDSQNGERGLEAGIVGAEIAEVARIRVGLQMSLAGFRRDQAAADVGGYPRIVFTRVPWTRPRWPWSHLNRLNLDGPGPARGHGAPPSLTLRAAPGFALPGTTAAHPYRLLDDRDKGHR